LELTVKIRAEILASLRDLLVSDLGLRLQTRGTLTRGLNLQAALQVGEIDLLVDGWHDRARRVGDANRWLPNWRYVQAVTLLLKVVHLALTRLRELLGLVSAIIQLEVVEVLCLDAVERVLLYAFNLDGVDLTPAEGCLPTDELLIIRAT